LQLQAPLTQNQHHQQDSCLKSKPSNPEQMAGTRAQLGVVNVLPPTLAFDASKRSLRWNPNSLPMPKVMAKWMLIWIVEKRKREGAVRMTILMLPAAPTAAKKIWYTKQHSVSNLGIGRFRSFSDAEFEPLVQMRRYFLQGAPSSSTACYQPQHILTTVCHA
jgi:hypothetical protein